MTNTEPVLTAGVTVGAISAVVAALIAFGVLHWAPEQSAAFMAATVAVLGVAGPLVAAWWARSQVVPVAKLEATPAGQAALRAAAK